MSTQFPTTFQDVFNSPEHAANYAEAPAKFMPGFQDVQKMSMILLREKVSLNASILVHGAGGGLELELFAKHNPEWSFIGVDPAKPMIDEAEKRMGEYGNDCNLHCGFIDTAPTGPYDGATSLLTLHFLEKDDRLQTLYEIRNRLKMGAPFVLAHSSFPQSEPARTQWLNRYAEFGIASGVDSETAYSAREAVSKMLPIFDSELDEGLLKQAGFSNVTKFYSAFTWSGWVCYA